MNLRSAFLFNLLSLCLAFSSVSAKEAVPMAEDPVVETRLVKISEELRCLVCQNESLASSRAELANDLREEVRGLIRQNKSDTDIKDFLVARYGDFVLYRPEIKPLTWLLWFGPFALFFIAILGTLRYLRGRDKTLPDQTLSDADRLRAEQLLKASDKP